MDAANWLSKCLEPRWHDTTHGDVRISMHIVEALFLNSFIWGTSLKKRSMAWKTMPKRISKYLADIDSLGKLPWGEVLGIEEMSLVLDEIAKEWDELVKGTSAMKCALTIGGVPLHRCISSLRRGGGADVVVATPDHPLVTTRLTGH